MCRGMPNRPTCLAANAHDATRRDFILVIDILYPRVEQHEVVDCFDYPVHQPVRIRVRARSGMKKVDKVRQMPNAADIFWAKMEELTEGKDAKEKRNIVDEQKEELHNKMDEALQERMDRLMKAEREEDAPTMLQLIAAATERGFIDYLQLKGREAESHRRRGVVKILTEDKQQHIEVNRMKHDDISAMKQELDRVTRQAARLLHMHHRGKKVHSNRLDDEAKTRLQLQMTEAWDAARAEAGKCHWNSTDEAIDAEELRRFEEIEQKVRDSPRAWSIVTRTRVWYRKRQEDLQSQLKSRMAKESKMQMESKKTGRRKMCRAVNGPVARPLMHLRRDRDTPDGQKRGVITTDPGQIDQIARRAWQRICWKP